MNIIELNSKNIIDGFNDVISNHTLPQESFSHQIPIPYQYLCLSTKLPNEKFDPFTTPKSTCVNTGAFYLFTLYYNEISSKCKHQSAIHDVMLQ